MDSQLRQECKALVQQLQSTQQQLNVYLHRPNQGKSESNSYVHVKDDSMRLKPAYARSKLHGAAKPLANGFTEMKNYDIRDNICVEGCKENNSDLFITLKSEPPKYSPSDLEEHSKSHLVNTKEHLEENSTLTSSCWQPATPNTQRKRQLIDRHINVPTSLSAQDLTELNNVRGLNYSYSHINADENGPAKFDYSKNDDNGDVKKPFKYSEDFDVSEKTDDIRRAKFGSDTNNKPDNVNKSSRYIKDVDTYYTESKSRTLQKSIQTFQKQLEDDGNNRALNAFIKDATLKPKSRLNSTGLSIGSLSSKRLNSSRGHCDEKLSTDHRLLGYDWIAALLDNDSSLMDQSETFFNDLKDFRRSHKNECSNQFYREAPHTLIEFEPEPVVEVLREPKVEPYIVNARLFTEPLRTDLIDYEGEDLKSSTSKRDPTEKNPRFVRVSIPRSTLQTPHRVKPHRRRSFDASDSYSLMDHCLLGWQTTWPSVIPTAKSMDLNAEAGMCRNSQTTTLAEAEKIAASFSYCQWPFDKPAVNLQSLPTWKKHYMDTTRNLTLPLTFSGNVTAAGGSVNRTTDKLLNSTYSAMYEMERLKEERRLEHTRNDDNV